VGSERSFDAPADFAQPARQCVAIYQQRPGAACRPAPGKNLRFEVRDTGPGIPADRYDDVFVEFEQLGNPQRDRRQGLGLGLAIVKRLASLLGHSIGLRSTLGRGSCFWIDVPLAQQNVLAEAPTGELLHQHHNPLLGSRVLVLDDESTILQSMRNLLAHWGCQVDSAANTDEAESALRSHVPDLLIADCRLGGESTGLDAVSQLRAIAREEIPVLIITGDTAPERLREARDSGYPLLHKPVPPARLRSAMQHLIKRNRLKPSSIPATDCESMASRP
jgi:CheY-like chemotaxis protein